MYALLEKPIKVLISHIHDPITNLAIENWIFRNSKFGQKFLFLYQNMSTGVIGRFQNPWAELNLKHMQSLGIPFVRRRSGGGCVFHDLGNLNFSFIANTNNDNREEHFLILLQALRNLGINAEKNTRNDLVYQGLKFSGSAFKVSRTKRYHHGTLLINSNLTQLRSCLKKKNSNIVSKATQSKRSPVINLSDIIPFLEVEKVIAHISQEFFSFYNYSDSPSHLSQIPPLGENEIEQELDSLKKWEWSYGHTPRFDHYLENDHCSYDFKVQFRVDKGIIEDANVKSNLNLKILTDLESKLIKVPYTATSIRNALSSIRANNELEYDYLGEFQNLIEQEIA